MTLIDTEMAAAMLRCTPRHVRNLINKGLLTNHGTPWKAKIDLAELSQAIHQGAITVKRKP